MKTGIQGVDASFHAVAARKLLGEDCQLVPAKSFEKLCADLREKKTDQAVMAIENSIAGSILTNYSLLEQNRFKIREEIYLRISFDLMALPGVDANSIESIESHPMALYQCQKYLLRLPNALSIESWDTAGAAKKIRDQGLSKTAAVASSLAAKVYGLEILAKEIETNKENYTRFLVVSREGDFEPSALSNRTTSPNRTTPPNKTTLRFETNHSPGSLARVLDTFSSFSINLTKIQSVPILGRAYRYSFHVDLQWTDSDAYRRAMDEVKPHISNLIHFGEYVSNRPSTNSDSAIEPNQWN